jgi:homoserine O-acetyltransferase
VARQAIMADPHWQGGDYYGQVKPDLGLAVARMIGHITYLSNESMRQKFGRQLRSRDALSFHFDAGFEVESYLRYQGNKFVERFDANSFLYLTKAADYFDLDDYGAQAFKGSCTSFLVVAFTSDWLYPTAQSRALVQTLKRNGLDVSFCEIQSDWGHDAFLLPNERLHILVGAFLSRIFKEGSVGGEKHAF